MTEAAFRDQRYYQVARPNSWAEKLAVAARDNIYADFLKLTRPGPDSTILDVGVSDVLGAAANVLERRYPHPGRITAAGLGTAELFKSAFPQMAYHQISAGAALPFGDKAFDIATSNAVLEHVGSPAAQTGFVSELVRVSRCTLITVPNRFFPVEHHTGFPLVHWADMSFDLACKLFRRPIWADRSELILMSRKRLRQVSSAYASKIGFTGIKLGPISSNLYLFIEG